MHRVMLSIEIWVRLGKNKFIPEEIARTELSALEALDCHPIRLQFSVKIRR